MILNLSTVHGTKQGVESLLDTFRRFPSLYSSWEDLVVNHLGNSEYEWVNGNIEMAKGGYRDYMRKNNKFELTIKASVEILDHDIEYLRHDLTNSVYPIPANTIPDNISPFWFETIESLCFKILRIHPPTFQKYRLYRYQSVKMMRKDYCRNYAERETADLVTAQRVCKEIQKRLSDIQKKNGDSFVRKAYKAQHEFHEFMFPKRG